MLHAMLFSLLEIGCCQGQRQQFFVRLLGSYGLLLFIAFSCLPLPFSQKENHCFFATSTQASAQEELAKLKGEKDSSKNAEVWVDLGGVMTDKRPIAVLQVFQLSANHVSW